MSQAKPSALAAFFTDRRVAPMLLLGFSSGMPFLLLGGTQAAWFEDAHLPIDVIGHMTWLTLAYKLKFLWAPFLERHDAPLLGPLLGRRRGWIVASQIAIVLTLAGVAFGDPAHWLMWTIGFSLALGVAGATQDICIDGWRINVAPIERQPLMSSWSEAGFRVGNLVAGAGALLLADRLGWRGAYLCMAALMLPGMIAALLAPEPPPSERDDAPTNLLVTVATPFLELVRQLGPLALPILVMVAGFRMPGYLSGAMAIPLFKTLHYSNSDIGLVTKLVGFGVALGGTFLASFMVPRAGMMATLLFGTVAASASHLSLAWLAAYGDHTGHALWSFGVAVGIDSFAFAFAQVVLIIYMTSITTSQHSTSQYALLTSIVAFPGWLLAGLSGTLVKHIGFAEFFVTTSLVGIPVAVLVWAVGRWQRGTRMAPAI